MQAELLLHLVLFVDRLPALCILAGLASHITYFRLLKKFPYISLTSVNGLISTGELALRRQPWLDCCSELRLKQMQTI